MITTTPSAVIRRPANRRYLGALFGRLRVTRAELPFIGMIPLGVKIELHGYDFLRDRKLQGMSALLAQDWWAIALRGVFTILILRLLPENTQLRIL